MAGAIGPGSSSKLGRQNLAVLPNAAFPATNPWGHSRMPGLDQIGFSRLLMVLFV